MSEDQEETILEYLRHLPERLREAKEARLEEQKRHLIPYVLERSNTRVKQDLPAEIVEGKFTSEGEDKTWYQRIPITTRFFLGGMLLYLLTRFIGLEKFPIYFFSDEAIQTLAIKDLINNGFRDPGGRFLPLYFNNGGQYNLSLSVYLQWLVAWLPNSVWLTRAVPALVTLVFPLSVSLALRDFFKIKTWWLAPFVISALPAWFLHSRTAFETCLGASMYALFLYFYLRYRHGHRGAIVWTVLFGALAFYAYAPMQLVVVLTSLVLVIVDFRYHVASWGSVAKGALALLMVALPYFVFRLQNPQALTAHLHLLNSYWLEQLSILQKMGEFIKRYLLGLDPTYWFISNSNDLLRHQMKGYAPMAIWTLPFAITGFVVVARKLKEPTWRVVLIALLVAPTGAALAEPTITRLMPMVVPLSFLICLGFDALIGWLDDKFPWRKSVAILLAGFIGLASLWMTNNAVSNGPLWYKDYGLYGMQWGGESLFKTIRSWRMAEPEKEIILSPTWANATDVLARFYLGDPLPVRLDTIQAWGLYYNPPLDDSKLFVMTPGEFDWMRNSPKFTDWKVRYELLWPDGNTGFYFVTLRYADNVEQVFEQEIADRKVPITDKLTLFGQDVIVKHSPLDIGAIAQAFDEDELSVIRGFEANPLEIKLEFNEPVWVSKVTVYVGSPPTGLTVTVTKADGQTMTKSVEVEGSEVVRPVSVVFGPPLEATVINIAVSNLGEPEPAHVHVWEVVIE
ncbi:MAG: hypothetical protein WBI14_09620 [Anaerolineaceae bacterium]